MVNRPVGPPSGPPVPTEGDWLRGSLPGLSVCPATAVIRIKLVSAAKSALLASLIAFLLRNEFKRCGRGDRAPRKSLRRQSPSGAVTTDLPRGRLAAARRRLRVLGADAPTTSPQPWSQRNCCRPRTEKVL